MYFKNNTTQYQRVNILHGHIDITESALGQVNTSKDSLDTGYSFTYSLYKVDPRRFVSKEG